MKTVGSLFVLALLAMPSFGCARSVQQVYPYGGPRASESIEIRVPQGQVSLVDDALRNAVAGAHLGRGTSITVSTRPDYQTNAATMQAKSQIYTQALDDARAKAQALASEEHLTLGSVESIQEILGNVNPAISPQVNRQVLSPAMVRVLPNQPVILLVSYRIAGGASGGSGNPVISVYGYSPQLSGNNLLNSPLVIAVDIAVFARRVQDAIAAAQDCDSLVRQTLSRLNVPPSAVRVIRSETFAMP